MCYINNLKWTEHMFDAGGEFMEVKNHINMEDLSSEDEDYNLWALLVNTQRVIFILRERELSQYGVTPEQAGTLHVIKHLVNQATLAKISWFIRRQTHTTSELVKRMVKKRLVKKVKNSDKKNLVKVVLTEKGQKAYHQSTKRESVHYIMSSLSEKERQQLRRCLSKLQDKASQILYPKYPWHL